ncbi:MAG: hypothetical protein ACE5JS_20770 [Nitrospinota bacterium]
MPRVFVAKGMAPGGAPAPPVRAFLAIPTYGGVDPIFVHSLWNSQTALAAAGIPHTLAIFSENCHVDDSRNYLVRAFLESDCTDLVFLDSDIGWDGVDIVKLLIVDRDIVGGVYPLKQFPHKFPVKNLPGEIWGERDGCVEVEAVPTGFLRIRRRVIEKLAAPADKFKGKEEPSERMGIPIIFERTFKDGQRYGGDYTFCRKARAAGLKIHTIPEMKFAHSGNCCWEGTLAKFWRREHGLEKRAFEDAIKALNDGEITEERIRAICDYWGNAPWAAGEGLLLRWAALAKEHQGDILECGSGVSSIVAAAASPQSTVWALEDKPEWGDKVSGLANRLGIGNLRVVDAPLGESWYSPNGEIPQKFGLVLVDGPTRGTSQSRFNLFMGGLDLENATVLWDDMDQEVALEEVRRACRLYGAEPSFIDHPSKNFAMAKLGNRVEG